jgi:ribose transport system substrate-binding protein
VDVAEIDGVAVSPLDAELQSPLINRLAKEIYVVTYDSDAPKSDRFSYIGTNNLQAGRRAGRLVREAIPKGGKVAVAIANLTKDNLIDRRAGFDEALNVGSAAPGEESKGSDYQVVAYMTDDGSDQRCRELLAETLAANPDLACLVGMNAQHGPILMRFLKQEDKLGDIAVVAFDEEAETLAGVEAGHIYATVAQDPYRYGYESVRSLADMCRGQEGARPLKGSFSTLSVATTSVTKDTLADFRRELAERVSAEPAEPASTASSGD